MKNKSKTPMTTNEKIPTRVRDPVCGMELDPSKAAGKQVFRGTTYYFDTVECAMKFGNSPDAFVNPPEVH